MRLRLVCLQHRRSVRIALLFGRVRHDAGVPKGYAAHLLTWPGKAVVLLVGTMALMLLSARALLGGLLPSLVCLRRRRHEVRRSVCLQYHFFLSRECTK